MPGLTYFFRHRCNKFTHSKLPLLYRFMYIEGYEQPLSQMDLLDNELKLNCSFSIVVFSFVVLAQLMFIQHIILFITKNTYEYVFFINNIIRNRCIFEKNNENEIIIF